MKIEIGPYPKGDGKRIEKVKIDDFDMWNLDQTLALIIAPALRKMKAAKSGIPGSFIDCSHHQMMEWGSPEFKAAERKSTAAGAKAWDKALTAMIWSFDQILNSGSPPLPDKRTKAAMARWHKKVDEHERRVAEGLRLFGEHYQALWT